MMKLARGRLAMSRYQPATSYSDAIARPICPKCGAKMMLARIEPDSPSHEKRMFECPACSHEISEIIEFKSTRP